MKCGEGFYLASRPSAWTPQPLYKTKNTPKVVGAVGEEALELISAVYEAVLEGGVTRVSSPAVAEMEKILENTYRNVNIGLVNELCMLCDRMGIDVWESSTPPRPNPTASRPSTRPRPGRPLHTARPLLPVVEGARVRLPHLHDRSVHDRERRDAGMGGLPRRPHPQPVRQGDDGREGPRPRRGLQAGHRRLPRVAGPARDRASGGTGRRGVVLRPWVPRYCHKAKPGNPSRTCRPRRSPRRHCSGRLRAHQRRLRFVQRHARAVLDAKNAMKGVSPRENVEVL